MEYQSRYVYINSVFTAVFSTKVILDVSIFTRLLGRALLYGCVCLSMHNWWNLANHADLSYQLQKTTKMLSAEFNCRNCLMNEINDFTS